MRSSRASQSLTQLIPEAGSACEVNPILPLPERLLASRDARLATLIASESERWPSTPSEHPIWGLIRIVMAQQVSTHTACRLAERVKCLHPAIVNPSSLVAPSVASLRELGLSGQRAACCVAIVERSDRLLEQIREGRAWE